MGDRTILHCDCNGFYASVECILRPELKNVPMAVCGDPDSRHGIILAKNELAKRCHVQTAETIWQAKRKCPELTLVPPHHEQYQKYSRIVNLIYQQYTDLVEPFGIDESWLDITGSEKLFGDGRTIADTLRRRIREEVGLTISVGVSFNKVFAKLGSDYKKPDATTVIDREHFRGLVWKLPVSDLLFVGKSVGTELQKMAITTIGELAAADRDWLVRRLGKIGETLHDYANGLDNSPVRSIYEEREVKSVGNGMTFKRNLVGLEDIRLGVLSLTDQVGARLRRRGVQCLTVQVTIRDPNFKTISRQRTLESPTSLAKELAEISLDIIQHEWDLRKPIRMLTITANNLVTAEETGEQMTLFNGESRLRKKEKQEKLEAALDSIRGKYGKEAIGAAGILGNDIGIGFLPEDKEENS
ncbi:DNA polymerase IV [Marasmitruncus massiliensis]|uniref:DNA polymerase IV n=1 Tax=Marasmitruncus massiliensis TaxID=1944642 RepID=UPI000C7A37A8|nr:DNA polymerase IV [Marasmitruncus massiliensis]